MKKYILNLLLVASVSIAAGTMAFAQKKPLDHDAYDSWESAAVVNVSRDGNLIVYMVGPQQGDAKLYLKNIATGQELVIDRGSAFSMPKDESYGVCTIAAPYAQTRQAKIDKKKPEEMPADSVAYINLKTFEMVKIANAKSAKMGQDAAPYIFVNQEIKGKNAVKRLLVVDTADGSVDTLKNISSFVLSRMGDKMAAVTAKDKKDSLSKNSVVLYDYAGDRVKVLSEDKKAYAALAFNNEGDKLVFMATDQEQKTDGTPAYSVCLAEEKVVRKATRKTPAVTEIVVDTLVAADAAGLPEGWVIGSTARPSFSNRSKRLVLSITEHVPAKDTTVVEFEAPKLDIWNWDSQYLPPMHKASPKRATRSAVINLADRGDILVVGANSNDRISYADGAESDYAISTDTDRYILDNMWAVNRRADISRVNLLTGEREVLEEGMEGSMSISPSGRYILWFNPEDGQWYSYDVAKREYADLTGPTGVAFYDEDDDHPMGFVPRAYPRWMGDDEFVVMADKYDIWKFTPDGRKHWNLTQGEGRKNGVQYALATIERPEVNSFLYSNSSNLPKKGRLYLSTFGEEDSRNGFASINAAAPSVPQGFLAEYAYSAPRKAKDSERIFYLKGNFQNPMDVHFTDDFWASETKLTDINPQQEEYIWGDVQLVHWDAYDGTPLKGLLFTPENLDPSKKYPMMVYFYEKYSETLYNYRSPAPSASTVNIPFFVSRGYVVFIPDIVYVDGHPGESAYNCICAGAEAMCEQFSFIDKSKMAIQGQSWGGYQTAYLVTRTNMFAAAGAGAPVGNMTSAYGGIRWESGNSRITQYEHGQSRIGATLWDKGGLDLYIENSPVFFAPNVETPVLIMHNDADGAVPWYQGIEFFMSLRRLGKPAWLLQYNDEAHNLMERRNRKDLSIRLSQFFDHYLKGEPAPVWMESGIPYARKGNYFGYEYAE